MNRYEARRRSAPFIWLMVLMLALPPGTLQRAQAASWSSLLTHDALMESFQNPQITSGQYNRFLMTQSPNMLIGGGGEDLVNPGVRGNRWAAEPNALGFDRVEWTEQDIVLPGLHEDFPFSRVYRGSVQSYDGPLGNQWDFNWNRRITRLSSGPHPDVELDDMGRKEVYTYDALGTTWTSPPGRYDHLDYSSSFIVRTDKYGIVESYANISGSDWFHLTTIEDLHGNTANFTYSSNRLSSISSDAGFFASIEYDGAGRISIIHDWGQSYADWKYTYAECADHVTRLVGVEGPPYANPGSLTNGRLTEYVYSSDEDHSMLKGIILPNKTDGGGGSYHPSWEFRYDSYPTQHLTTEYINGNPLAISYDLTHGKTTVIDRESNGTVYEYDTSARITKRKVYYDSTHSYDSTWAYDGNNEVTEAAFPNGNRVDYTYDSLGNILTVDFKKDGSDSSPVRWVYTYATHSRLSTLTDPNGHMWDYDYDDYYGELTRKTAPTVTVPIFDDSLSGTAPYNPSNTNKNSTLNGTNDGSIVETWAYDEYGNVTAHTDPMGTVWNAAYAGSTGATDPKPMNLTKLIHDPGGIRVTYRWVYDGLGRAITYIDPQDSGGNRQTYYTWNTAGDALEVREPGGVQTDYVYDANDNVIQITKVDDNKASNGAFLTDMAYDLLNNITTVIMDQDASTTARLTTSYAYDKNDRLTQLTQPGGQVTEWTYEVRDLPAAVTRHGTMSGDDAITSMVYDSNGNRTTVVDPLGNSKLLAYDGYDRLTRVSRPEGDYRTLAYDKAGNLTDGSGYESGGTKLAESKYSFDEANRLYQVDVLAKRADLSTNLASIDNDGWQTKTLWRDENGNVLDIRGDVVGSQRGTFSYDALGRCTMQTDALASDANSVLMDYDLIGNLTTLTHDNKSQAGSGSDLAITVAYVYDVRDRVITRRDKLATATYADTLYGYGKRDQLTRVQDGATRITNYEYNESLWPTLEWATGPSGGTATAVEHLYDTTNRRITYRAENTTDQDTVYVYDPMWRLITTAWPNANASIYSYDQCSNRISYTDPNGTVRVAAYDKNNRLTVQDHTFVSPVVGPTKLTYGYDALDRLASAETFEASGFTAYNTWTYDTLGCAETEQQVIAGYNSHSGRTFSYVWDVSGERLSATYPTTGTVVGYARDELGRVDKMSLGSTELVDYTYCGNRVLQKSYAGSKAVYSYDGFGRVNGISHQTTGGANRATFVYGYDSGHQVTYMNRYYYNNSGVRITSDATMDHGDQYAYDDAGRLTRCLRGVPDTYITDAPNNNTHCTHTDEYVYDEVGNRLNRKIDGTLDTAYAYDSTNEMTTEGAVSQSYTPNGDFAGPSDKYKYDFADRLGEGTSDQTYKYHYDAIGRLVQRDHGTSFSIRFYYDGLQCVEQNRWQSSAEGSRKLFVFGPQIDELLMYKDLNVSPNKTYYAHADRLGSVQLLVDGSGAIQESYRYKEFGETTIVDAGFNKLTTTVNSVVGCPHMFTGQRQDVQLGSYGDDWYCYRARIMRPNAGRFLQRDPHRYWGGPSLYPYVGSNPANFIDPLGRDPTVWSDSDGTVNVAMNIHIFIDDPEDKENPEEVDPDSPWAKELIDMINSAFNSAPITNKGGADAHMHVNVRDTHELWYIRRTETGGGGCVERWNRLTFLLKKPKFDAWKDKVAPDGTVYKVKGRTVDGDMDIGPGFDKIKDQYDVVVHEVGHAMGLDDAYEFDDKKGLVTTASGNIMGAQGVNMGPGLTSDQVQKVVDTAKASGWFLKP